MGTLASKETKFRYKRSKGVNQEGSEITDPYDFFEAVLENFAKIREVYSTINDEQKRKVQTCLGVDDWTLANKGAFEMWLINNEGSPELAEAYQNLQGLIAAQGQT